MCVGVPWQAAETYGLQLTANVIDDAIATLSTQLRTQISDPEIKRRKGRPASKKRKKSFHEHVQATLQKAKRNKIVDK
jgi:hypothetical protein